MNQPNVLQPASENTKNELLRNSSDLVATAAARYTEIETTVALSAEAHHRMVLEGLKMTSHMLVSFLAVASEPLIREQLQWSVDRLPHEGLPPASIVAGLRIYKDTLTELFTPAASSEIVPYLDFMIVELNAIAEDRPGGNGA